MARASLPRWGACVAALAIALQAPRVHADVDLSRALAELAAQGAPRVLEDRVSVITDHALPGSVAAGDGWFTLSGSASALAALAAAHPEAPLWWAAPRRLLLDRVDGWVRASSFRNATGLTGRGVVIGIIDSGVDPSHPDLQTADGKTRVRWWLDFSRPPAGRHPELEDAYGCNAETECAVLSGDDLDELLANEVANDEPRDTFGHGTHVASLAAGNGLSNDPPKYVGVAPEASLIVVRVAKSGGGGILDADVLQAARFVFERAEELGMPAVVNMSLGSDFGGHDGSSALELGLASLVGDRYPGRALVVAAGNSAGLFTGASLGLPEPLGVHTEVHVPRSSPVLVPLFTQGTNESTLEATIYVWISTLEGDELELGLDDDDGEWVEPLKLGQAAVKRKNGVEATIINQADDTDVTRGGHGAVVVIDGKWASSRHFQLRLEGHATAALWVQSEGDLGPDVSAGALFPRALKAGTINVPASSPDLIAVGATLNRNEWLDYQNNHVSFPAHGALEEAPLDTTAFYSSAGPTAQGLLKPDIVAPGGSVVGAMSHYADPRSDGLSGTFASLGRCPPSTADECFVVDDYHAVTSGTSMASPIVAGAVALLLERDPTLTEPQVRALVQAGARPLEGVIFSEQQAGAGALDLEGALLAAVADDSPAERLPSAQSWIALAAPYVRPDGRESVQGLVEVRDERREPADAFDSSRLRLTVSHGTLPEALHRVRAGLYGFSVSAPDGSGGGEIELGLYFDDEPLVLRTLPIAVDHAVAEQGVAARGGCTLSVARTSGSRATLGALLALIAWRGRELRRAARTARRRDRTGEPTTPRRDMCRR